jgi:hypothetical protein
MKTAVDKGHLPVLKYVYIYMTAGMLVDACD